MDGRIHYVGRLAGRFARLNAAALPVDTDAAQRHYALRACVPTCRPCLLHLFTYARLLTVVPVPRCTNMNRAPAHPPPRTAAHLRACAHPSCTQLQLPLRLYIYPSYLFTPAPYPFPHSIAFTCTAAHLARHFYYSAYRAFPTFYPTPHLYLCYCRCFPLLLLCMAITLFIVWFPLLLLLLLLLLYHCYCVRTVDPSALRTTPHHTQPVTRTPHYHAGHGRAFTLPRDRWTVWPVVRTRTLLRCRDIGLHPTPHTYHTFPHTPSAHPTQPILWRDLPTPSHRLPLHCMIVLPFGLPT